MLISISFTTIALSAAVITGISILVGILLGFVAEKFKVAVDEKESRIRECLAGSNCGACGYAGCDACAKAMAEGKAPANACAAGNIAMISQLLGVEAVDSKPRVAYIKCLGNCLNTESYYNFTDEENCRICYTAQGHGPKKCSFSCCGYGLCASACKNDAIEIINGLAKVIPEKCIGCGACVKACPAGIIELIPYDSKYIVGCSSHDKGKDVKAACSVGCIGCGICVKNCKNGAVTLTGNLAYIDREKCTGCGSCAEKCPAKVIIKRF